MSEIHEISLDKIVPFPGNRRVGGFDHEKLEQLAESIRDIGVQQPAIVRPTPDEIGFELVAGERRWRASAIAEKETLPCIVKPLTDLEALKIQLIENLQRDDVHPLDESQGFAQLLESREYDVATLSSEIGRSKNYVYQRLKLLDLVEPAREALLEGSISAGHALQIARLTPELQAEALEYSTRFNNVTVRDLANHISERMMLVLSASAFKKDDADLVPEAGPCSMCQKRTGRQPELFADLASDSCMDSDCFNAKLDAFVDLKRARLEEKGEKFFEACDTYVMYEDDIKKGVICTYDWEHCKKEDPGAQRVLIAAGPNRGRVTTGRKRSDIPKPPPDLEWEREQLEREKERKIQAQLDRRVWDQVLGIIEREPESFLSRTDSLRILVQAAFGQIWSEHMKYIVHHHEWEQLENDNDYGRKYEAYPVTLSREIEHMSNEELLRLLLTILLTPYRSTGQYPSSEKSLAQEICELASIPVAEIEREVRAEATAKEPA